MQEYDQRLIDLETKVSYQEETVQQLNEVASQQQKQLDKVEASLIVIHKRVQELLSALSAIDQSNPIDEKPPHY